MNYITIELPEEFIKHLNPLIEEENVRISKDYHLLREYLRNDINFFIEMLPAVNINSACYFKSSSKLELENYCINCGRKLGNPGIKYKFREFKIRELRFCCFCYKKFNGTSLDAFPDEVLKKIEEKLRRWNSTYKFLIKF